jgi:hypothetical protein
MARGQQKIQSQQKAQEKQVPYTHAHCAVDLCQKVAVPVVDKAKSSVADPGSGAFLTPRSGVRDPG